MLSRLRINLARVLVKGMALPTISPWLRHAFLEPTFDSLVREGYQKNAVVGACISALTRTFPEPPLLVYGDESPDAQPLPTHPLRRLIRRPNPRMGEDTFAQYLITYMALGGTAYGVAPLSTGGLPAEVWPYHAGQVRPIPGGETWVRGYEFLSGDGEWVALDPDTYLVIPFHWPTPDPISPWQAQPPLRAAARHVDTSTELDAYVYSLLKNDAVVRGVLELPPDAALTESEYRRMRAQWEQRHGGDRRGGIAILEGGAKYSRVALDLQELATDALRGASEQAIAAAFGVPLSVAGIGDDPTYSNSEEAYRRFTRSTLTPLWRLVASTYEASLGQAFGGVVCRHDLGQVAALQEDANQRWTRVTAAFTAGLISLQAAQRALGFPDAPPDELYAAPIARELLPLSQITDEATAAQGAPSAPPEKVATPILGYHIETGVVSRNEARLQLGLSPEDESNDERLRRLQIQLAVLNAATLAGFDLPTALRLVGMDPGLAPGASAEQRALPDARQPAAKAARDAARIARSLQRVRGRVAARMAPAIETWFDGLADTVAGRAKALPDANELVQIGDFEGLKAVISRYVVELVRASWEVWNTALDDDAAFDLADPAVAAALRSAGQRITAIAETTRAAVQELLTYGAEQGWTIGQLVAGTEDRPGLRDLVSQTYRGRAQTIARTELGTAQQAAAVARYKAAGITRVQVLDNGMDDSDPRCTELNGTVQTLAWAEANPLQHPNCVRAFAPVVE